MDMQDKELDNLFRSKLDGFEVEPSAMVWQNIDTELTGKRKKAVLLPVLSAAASIIVLATAGALFTTHKISNIAQKPVKVAEVIKKESPKKEIVKQPMIIANTSQQKVAKVAKQASTQQWVKNYAPVQQPVDTISKKQAIAGPAPQKLIASLSETHLIQPQANKIDTIAVVIRNMKPQAIDEPTVVAANTTQVTKPAAQTAKRHHIHSLGDMLNTVIAAVDKRKDKIIEFSDTDDNDESNITGVNLGIVAVKKQN
jgi:hypothetical protein